MTDKPRRNWPPPRGRLVTSEIRSAPLPHMQNGPRGRKAPLVFGQLAELRLNPLTWRKSVLMTYTEYIHDHHDRVAGVPHKIDPYHGPMIGRECLFDQSEAYDNIGQINNEHWQNITHHLVLWIFSPVIIMRKSSEKKTTNNRHVSTKQANKLS